MAKKTRNLIREQERLRRQRQRRIIYIAAGAAVLIVLVGVGLLLAAPKPVTNTQVAVGACGPIESPADGGRDHLLPNQTPSYTSNPPASGAHNQNPQPRGIYDSPIDVTMEVHSLEHGYVIIHYNGIPSDQQQQLRDIITRDPFKMILSPYPSMTHGISLTAWDHLQTCAAVDQQAIASFVAQFRNHGPENTPE